MSAPKTDPLTLLVGDAAEMLRTLPEASVQCCVTSPPYWGLRDYGTARWEGGDAACDHLGRSITSGKSTLGEWKNGGGQKFLEKAGGIPFQKICGKCGAVRIDNQIGLEPTPEAFVERLVGVFREVWRVLKDDGTLWMNLGDSYAASRSYQVSDRKNPEAAPTGHDSRKVPPLGMKPKDLIGIPWMVAFALRADGWYLRQDIIWHKPNPMPESVTDRCTKAHEYLFLLTKSQRYYYDAAAIAEAAQSGPSDIRKMKEGKERIGGKHKVLNDVFSKASALTNIGQKRSVGDGIVRNRRSVWTEATVPYSEAHFATYPPDLIRPCIRAGSRPGDVVLDPFGGSGTTGQVALEEGRRAVLIELNPEYAALCRKRCSITLGLGL